MSLYAQGGPQIANYPFGFAQGLAVQQLPILNTYPGKVFWVDSNFGDDGGPGTFQKPWATLQNAVTRASSGGYAQPMAARGDMIMLKAGHAETISSATAMNISVAGLQIVGVGFGETRPKFTLDTGTSSTITISAANVSFTNCQFVGNFAAIVALFTLTTAKGFGLYNNDIRDASASLGFLDIVKLSTSANANDGLTISGNRISQAATTGACFLVEALGTHDRILIAGNLYRARTTGTGAVIPIATGKVLTNCDILNNLFDLKNAVGTGTGYIITTDGSTNSGFIHGNYDHALPGTPLFCTASSGFVYGLNYHSDVADLAGYLVPAADI